MRRNSTEILPGPTEADHASTTAVARRLRRVAAYRSEEILREVPGTLRHLRRLLLALTIAVPVFLVLLAAALWHLTSR